VTSNNVVCFSSSCFICHEEQDDGATFVEQDDGATHMTVATDIEVCHGLLAVTSNKVACFSSSCFIGHVEQGGEAEELDEGSQVVSVTCPKRSSRPKRSKRLIRMYPRRSSRIAAARQLAEKYNNYGLLRVRRYTLSSILSFALAKSTSQDGVVWGSTLYNLL